MQIVCYGGEGESTEEQITSMARIKVALDFAKQPKAVQFRALLEGWNSKRIVRELY